MSRSVIVLVSLLLLAGCASNPYLEQSLKPAAQRHESKDWFEKEWGKPSGASKRFWGGESWTISEDLPDVPTERVMSWPLLKKPCKALFTIKYTMTSRTPRTMTRHNMAGGYQNRRRGVKRGLPPAFRSAAFPQQPLMHLLLKPYGEKEELYLLLGRQQVSSQLQALPPQARHGVLYRIDPF